MKTRRLKPLRVLHVMASGARGGGADHLLGLLPAQRAQGLEVCAAVGGDGPTAGALAALGIGTQILDVMGRRLSPAAIRQLSAVCRSDVDVIHLHGTRAAFFAAVGQALAPMGARWGRRHHRCARLYTAHGLAHRQAAGGWRRRLRWAAEALVCRHVDAVVSVSKGDLQELTDAGLAHGRIAAHVPNAVDVRRFGPASQKAARARLGLPEGVLMVGTTARLVAQKAVGDLLDAVWALPGVHLAVIGEGPLRPSFEAHPLVQTGRAVLLGARDDVADILPAFDVFALSSHWEGEPIALLEALATGLACVSTATFGAQEIFAQETLGKLVPIGDVPAMTRMLATLCDDADLRASLGAAGRQAMFSRTFAAQAQALTRVYDAIVPP